MKQIIVLVATVVLGIALSKTVVGMGDGVKELAGAVSTTVESTFLNDGALDETAFITAEE